jgi:transposase
MLDLHDLPDTALMKLPLQVQAMIERLQQRIAQQGEELAHQQQQLGDKTLELSRKEREIAWRDARLEKIQFELARLKRWQFGAKSEAMNAEQRALFAETMLEDEADLKARLAKLQGQIKPVPPAPKPPASKPRRQALPEHLRREEHRHEPSDTHCPNDGCGRPMQRVGEDVSEKLDIVPAQFFVHRHIYGKWACRCCQTLTQEPAEPDVIDGGIPASGLVAHTLISRFVDHLPYYRQEDINARAGVHTPRSSLTAWSGAGGAALEPLREVLKDFVLSAAVLHADETPIPLLDPGAGKTKKAYVWAYYLERIFIRSEPIRVSHACGGKAIRTPNKFDRSQRLQERKQVGRGLPHLCVRRFDAGLLPKCLHGLALHLQVDRDVAVGRGDAGMSEVVTDHRHVGARLQ